MSVNIEIRRNQLENLQQFIGDARKKLHSVLDYLEWTEEKVKQGVTATCTINPNHKVPVNRLEGHQKKCKLKNLNYDLKEPFLSEPLHHPRSSVYISNQKKFEILSRASQSIPNFRKGWNGHDPDPQTADRLTSTFTQDERLVLYNYARGATVAPEKPPEFNVIDSKATDKELSYEEVLEQERNAKRRRIKYKAVHTSRKNHTEVLRDVIANQMEVYEDWMAEKIGVKGPDEVKKVSDEDPKEFKRHRDCAERKRDRSKRRSPSPYRSHKRSTSGVDKRFRVDDRARRYK